MCDPLKELVVNEITTKLHLPFCEGVNVSFIMIKLIHRDTVLFDTELCGLKVLVSNLSPFRTSLVLSKYSIRTFLMHRLSFLGQSLNTIKSRCFPGFDCFNKCLGAIKT